MSGTSGSKVKPRAKKGCRRVLAAAATILSFSIHMKLKSGTESDYAKYKEMNQDPYGGRVVSYSEDWANLMEARIEGLSRFWEHGEALRLWHNLDTQIKNEGEIANKTGGVLNPAILNIKL